MKNDNVKESSKEGNKKKIIIICSHLSWDRLYRRDTDFMQPMVGLHIASLINREKYHVKLHHEMYHGPYNTRETGDYHLVFLSGLQKDFDRMRQLSFFFRRKGALVIAGGSICTLFPEFSQRFFDVVCVGGVEAVKEIMKDYETGSVKKMYVSPQQNISKYAIDHSILNKSSIHIMMHLTEASRGCNYKCGFCTLPAENAGHAVYNINTVIENIKNSLANSPVFSLKRIYPLVWFIDNNFANNIRHTKALCNYLKKEKKVKAWGALVSQNILSNRGLIKFMAASNCRAIYTGIESLDINFLESHNKKQNVANAPGIIDDIEYAQKQGIIVIYGILFDPRISSVAEMKAQVQELFRSDILTFPNSFSYVSPLLGTPSFLESAKNKELLPNLRLRDLEGSTLAFRNLIDPIKDSSGFLDLFIGNPHLLVKRKPLWKKTLKYMAKYRIINPLKLITIYRNNFRQNILEKASKKTKRTTERNYIGGTDILDPQYDEYPEDISREDKERYFEPVMCTDERGNIARWLISFSPVVLQANTELAA